MKSGYVYWLGSGVAWGLSGVISGIAVGMAPFSGGASLLAAPLAAAALSDGLRALWQLGQLLVRRRPGSLRAAATGRYGRWAMLAALAGGPLAASCYYVALVYSGITYAYTLSAMAPALGALLAAVFLGERLPRAAWVGMALVIAGSVIVSYEPPEGASPHFHLGALFALACALGWALEALFVAKALERLDSATVNMVRQGLSFVVFLAVLLPFVPGAYRVFVAALHAPSAAVLAASAVVSVVGYVAYYKAVGAIGPGRAMPINLTYVLWAALFSLLLTGERPAWRLLAGAVAVIAGTTLVASERRGGETAAALEAMEPEGGPRPTAPLRGVGRPAADERPLADDGRSIR